MSLALAAVIGFVIGYRLEMTRAGYISMALTAIGFSAGQIAHLLLAQNRASMTLLPLVVGLVIVLFMLLGGVLRVTLYRNQKNA